MVGSPSARRPAPLRHEPLLGQALREESPPRRIPSPEEEPRTCPEVGRESHEALRGWRKASVSVPPPSAPRLHARPHGALGASLDDLLPRRSPDRIEQEKEGRSA